MFINTQGKGFRIEFDNGYALSVQWGPGNYCDHRYNSFDFFETKAKDISIQSLTAEIAIFNPDGKLLYRDDWSDSVKGYCTPKEVAFWMNMVANMPSIGETNGN